MKEQGLETARPELSSHWCHPSLGQALGQDFHPGWCHVILLSLLTARNFPRVNADPKLREQITERIWASRCFLCTAVLSNIKIFCLVASTRAEEGVPAKPVGQVHFCPWIPVTSWFLTLVTACIQSGAWLCPLIFIYHCWKNSEMLPWGTSPACSAGSWARLCTAQEGFRLLRLKGIICGKRKVLPDKKNNSLLTSLNSEVRTSLHPVILCAMGSHQNLSLNTSDLGDLGYGLDWADRWSWVSTHWSLFVWVFLILCLNKSVFPMNVKIVMC